ncbi:MAG: hypothetical protein ACRD38_12575, partial [Nitrososphaerales archaeon]
MERDQQSRLKYKGITLAVVLVTSFMLVQPIMNQAYSVDAESESVGIEAGVSPYDDCTLRDSHEDPISMDTVRSGAIVKTIHAEKEIFDCFVIQGHIPVIVDVTTFIEVFEDINTRQVTGTRVLVTTCLKQNGTATVLDCGSSEPGSTTIPLTNCMEDTDITHPMEMNTVVKANANIAKTVEAQKEVFLCDLDGGTQFEPTKKVDIVLFTEIYENMVTRTIIDTQFYSMRCVLLITDNSPDKTDATVESC